MFPFLDSKVINKVDAAIDNPTPMDMIFADMQRQTQSQVFVPSMYKGGHRAYNHDIFGALMKGFEQGGTDGIYAAMSHLLVDAVKDSMNRQFGMYGADMLENMFLFLNEKKKPRFR